MSNIYIEIDPNIDSQQWRQDFEGVTYLLKFCYNDREGIYNFELYDTENGLIASSPIVLGTALFSECPDERLPPGLFIAIDISGEGGPANQEKLGRSVFLIYQESV
jgi:hypothetical protein